MADYIGQSIDTVVISSLQMKQHARHMTRRSPRTLIVHRETLRVLANVELTRVGGAGARAAGSGPVDSCAPEECTLGAA